MRDRYFILGGLITLSRAWTASRISGISRLFVRERKQSELGTRPFTFLGPATYVDHAGERPVACTWRLATPMPHELFEVARSVAAA